MNLLGINKNVELIKIYFGNILILFRLPFATEMIKEFTMRLLKLNETQHKKKLMNYNVQNVK